MSNTFPLVGRRVWVAGHSGMVGRALMQRLADAGASPLSVDRETCDLRDQATVRNWVAENRPEAVIVAAALVGGIEANRTRPAEFLYDNLSIAANIIHAAAAEGVSKLMFLGSSCFYPRDAEQPIREDSLLTGPLEPTNQWYAVAKIAGVKLCQAYRRQYGKDFIAVVPTNLYGPGDNFDPLSSHVIPGLLSRFHEAKTTGAESVQLWGTGNPRREFLYVDDAARALVSLLENYSAEEIVNVAGGEEVSIREVAEIVAEVVGFTGQLTFDTSRPDGMPRKALDPSYILATGWRTAVGLRAGIESTYRWYLDSLVTSGPV